MNWVKTDEALPAINQLVIIVVSKPWYFPIEWQSKEQRFEYIAAKCLNSEEVLSYHEGRHICFDDIIAWTPVVPFKGWES